MMRRMRIEQETKLDYCDVLLRPKRSTMGSRRDADLERSIRFANGHVYRGIPVIAANMDGVGTLDMAVALRKHGLSTALTKHIPDEHLVEHFLEGNGCSIYTMGTTQKDVDKFERVNAKSNPLWVCIDVANGYSEKFIDFVARFGSKHIDKILVAGNVATPDIVEELVLKGVDIVKIGIGPGSVCTTRTTTGVGVPQLSAVIECSDAAHGLDAHIIADGGCNTTGDIAKAFAGGADFVMLGNMLAGTEEGGMSVEGSKEVPFYGMSSDKANDIHGGGEKEYRTSEGRDVLVSYKGSVDAIVKEILGGLRSACTYIGARRIKDMPKCATFIRCNTTHNRIFE